MAKNPYSAPKRNYLPMAITAVLAGAVGFGCAALLLPTSNEVVYIDQPQDAVSQPQLANAVDSANRGDLAQAREQINSVLASTPDSYTAQLIQADIAVKEGRTQEAETLLTRLSQRFPNRPEALNNLASIAAQRSEYDTAIAYLVDALNGNPSYQTVYNNLKELHTVQASLAYSKALGLESEQSGPSLKSLTGIQSLTAPATAVARVDLSDSNETQGVMIDEADVPPLVIASVDEPTSDTTTEASPIEVSEAPLIVEADDVIVQTPDDDSRVREPLVINLDQLDTAPQDTSDYTNIPVSVNDSITITALENTNVDPEIQAEENFDSESVAAQLQIEDRALEVTSEQIEAETARAEALLAAIEQDSVIIATSPASLTIDESDFQQQVSAHIQRWADAWQSQNVNDYIASYIVGFEAADGRTYESWKELREARITRPDYIEINIDQMEIERISDNEALVTFTQGYTADHYQDSERKQLRLMFRTGGWKIISETTI